MQPLYLLLGVFALVFGILFLFRRKKQGNSPALTPRRAHRLLQSVRFYKNLPPDRQEAFRNRVLQFLQTVRITPAQGVKIRALDRIYVAAAAIIPVFHKPDWEYTALDEVVIRSGNFSKDFRGAAEDENVMGMVGDGFLNRLMVIGLGALRTGFEQQGRGNTAIHEFVHLIDKTDGAVDGVPEALLPEELAGPWLQYMQEAITEIRSGKERDINEYGGRNEAEFLAVVSEYYFQRPEYLAESHPELFSLLEQIYKPDETAAETTPSEASE